MPANGYGCNTRHTGHVRCECSDASFAGAQLSVVVRTPSPYLAILVQCQAMVADGCDRNDALQRSDRFIYACGTFNDNWYRVRAMLPIPAPEITEVVVAPRPHRAIFLECNGVPMTTSHLLESAMALDHRRDGPICSLASSQLAITIVTPCPDPASGVQTYRMVVSARQRSKRWKSGYTNGCVAVRESAIAELAMVIAANRPGYAVLIKDQCMPSSGVNLLTEGPVR